MTGRHFLTGRHLLTGVLLLLVGNVVPAFAQSSRANPYQQLFQTRDLKAVARMQQRNEAPRPSAPRVVCGMTIIPADPKIDPKMAIGRPRDDVRYTMRSIEPSICK